MKDKLDAFLNALRSILERKGETPAMARDLSDPDKFAEHISHSIGSSTQRITFTKPETNKDN
jgi:hypothetical protein